MLRNLLKKSIFLLTLFAVAQFVFAVSGKNTGEENAGKAKVYSNLKTAIPFSLQYGHSYTGSKTFGVARTNQFMVMNSLITYQRGNVVYVMPHQSRISIPKFIKLGPISRMTP